MKKLYAKYINDIQSVISKPISKSHLSETFYNFSGTSETLLKSESSGVPALAPLTGLEELARLMNIKEIKRPVLGDHPDFKHLRNERSVDYHYITSMFIDVKNSTKLHRKYDLSQIAMIIQTIITAATHTCALFGGHIQRLQYDGVFAYFGGRNIDKNESVKMAINAASFFSYFVKYELREVFQLEEIDNIYTRIGIDFGDDDDVQWLVFGTQSCSELTTNSLHTSLAPKMQSFAESNGIMIGNHVKERIGELELFCDNLRDSNGNIDQQNKYIYVDSSKNFRYEQFKFKWVSYLRTYSFVKADEDGKLYIDYQSDIESGNNELDGLYEKAKTMNSGRALISPLYGINSNQGAKIPPHQFHYVKK